MEHELPPIRVVSFTGARSVEQNPVKRIQTLSKLLKQLKPIKCVFGMAPGWDSIFYSVCRDLRIQLKGWPANPKSIEYCPDILELEKVKPPLERDHDIVADGELLIACPPTDHELIRSGSWATARYNRNLGKPLVHILLSGAWVFYPTGDWR